MHHDRPLWQASERKKPGAKGGLFKPPNTPVPCILPLQLGDYLTQKNDHTLHCMASNVIPCSIRVLFKLQSHYSDNQSPTSDNHFFLGGCRRLSEVGKCLSMIADQSAIGCQRITSTTSRRPPTTTFLGVFFGGIRWSANDCRWSLTSRRLVGDWLSEQLVGERFSLQHRKPFADQTSWAFAVHRPWIWIKMVWAFSAHIVYFRFARPQARENRWCAQFGMSARACLLSVY